MNIVLGRSHIAYGHLPDGGFAGCQIWTFVGYPQSPPPHAPLSAHQTRTSQPRLAPIPAQPLAVNLKCIRARMHVHTTASCIASFSGPETLRNALVA